MARLLWSEDNDVVYGWFDNYENEEDFVKHVKEEYDGKCDVIDVKAEHCISTEEGIEGETVIPIRLTDVQLELMYTAKVEDVG